MRYIKKLLIVIALGVVLIGCSEYKDIPSQDLEAILTESLLRRSVLNNTTGKGVHRGSGEDSVDYHSDILRKYGYTLADFKHTIETMAKRKSNPLDGILNNVLAEIDEQAAEAEYRYTVAHSFDTTALNFYRDTLYYANDFKHGSFKGLDTIRIADTLFKRGVYSVNVEYQTMSDYRYPSKSVKYYFASRGEKAKAKTLWLSRSSSTRVATTSYVMDGDPKDSLVFYFEEVTPSYVKKKVSDNLPKDTSFVHYVMILYTPHLEDARRDYLNSMYGDFILDREFPEVEAAYKLDVWAPHVADTIFAPIDSTLFRLDSLRMDSIRMDSIRLDSIRLDSIAQEKLKLNDDEMQKDSI